MRPVDPRRIAIASEYLANAEAIATTCREASIPFPVACALFEKESGGRNVYGHDAGGALSGFNRPVTEENFYVFEWLITEQGMKSNGVGPAQITYKGYFPDMRLRGLKPWDVHDNMLYGLRILRKHWDSTGSWAKAGTLYNAGNLSAGVNDYGRDLEKKIAIWRDRFSG